mmetsp:Transcript_31127/g.71857  ORF Transcript_31127/g.71857 Transcript_31127/m.71857 type:complete len:342 (-) Transcript_31127:2390-3415(-)
MPFDGSESLVDKAQSFSQRKGQSVIRVVLQPQLHANIDDFRGGALFAVLIALEDDGDDQVHDHHRDEQCVRHPEAVGEVRTLSTAVGMLDETLVLKHLELREGVEQVRGRTPVTLLVKLHLTHGEVVHDLVPRFPGRAAEEGDKGLHKVLKVAMWIKGRELQSREQAHAKNRVQGQEQQENRHHVHQLGNGRSQGRENLLHAFDVVQQSKQPRHTEERGDAGGVYRRSMLENDPEQRHDHAEEIKLVPPVLPVGRAKGVELRDHLKKEDPSEDSLADEPGVVVPVVLLRKDPRSHGGTVHRDRQHDKCREVDAANHRISLPPQRRHEIQVRDVEEAGVAKK